MILKIESSIRIFDISHFQVTGEPLIRRADDNPETLRKRLATYHKQTSPLVEFYTKRRLLRQVDASLDSTTIFSQITKIFEDMKSKLLLQVL